MKKTENKQNALVLSRAKPALPEKWHYDDSVKKSKHLLCKLRNLTEKFLNELWIAREKLRRPGTRTDLLASAKRLTWTQYCKDIGSSVEVVDRWLFKAFGPSESTKALPADDDIPDIGEAITKPGDLWILGKHRLLCGDATKLKDVKRLIYPEKADICITSPPYNIGRTTGGKKRYPNYNDKLSDDDYVSLLIYSTSLALIVCEYVFVNTQELAENKKPLVEYKSKSIEYLADIQIWDKGNLGAPTQKNVLARQFEAVFCFSKSGKSEIGTIPFLERLSNIIYINSRRDKQYSKWHHATFPVEFAAYFVTNFARPESIIYDPFVGTGSTLIACEKLDRRCYAMDIDPHSCDITIERWREYTKQQPTMCQRNGALWLPDGLVWQRQYISN